MKNTNDPFMRLRIILASLALIIILGGWVVYGIIFLNTNPAKMLTRVSEIEKEKMSEYIDKIDLKKEMNYTISLDDHKNIYIYANIPENKLYIYNDTEYYSLTDNITMSTDPNVYKDIFNSILDSLTHNYKLLDTTKKKDDNKNYYIYSYSLNELYPIISTLKTDKTFIDSLKNSLKLSDEKIIQLSDQYNNNSIGINIVAKGAKRDIVYYNFKIDNLFDIYKEDNYIKGFFLNYGFIYDKELIIYTENHEYHATINKSYKRFNKEEYQASSLEKVLSIIE